MISSSLPCPRHALEPALRGELDPHETERLEQHLETCSTCRQQLSQLAAEPDFWNRATEHLSATIEPLPSLGDSGVLIAPTGEPAGADVPPSPSQHSFSPASHPETLGRVDQFEIEEEIGRGGCGVVYRGFDTHLNRPVAIKFLASHLASNGVARQRFSREARAAAAVMHPNVVPIHHVKEEVDHPYLVMGLVDGRSLEAHVRKHGPLEMKEAVRIAMQVASGLAAAHRQGLIHRDIKPANILIEQDVSRVMITDFGLARAADDSDLTQTGWLAGTPHYMSPEQARGDVVDRRSDLFSLGSLMYFMVTGREPFRAEKPFAVMQNIINRPHLPACAENSDVTATFSQLIDKLLEKDRRDRFATADEVQRRLEKYLAHLNNPHLTPRPRRILTRRQKRMRLWGGIAAAGVALLALAVWQAWPAKTTLPSGSGAPSTSPYLPPSATAEFLRSLEDVKSFEEIGLELQQIQQELNQLEWQLEAAPFGLGPELPPLPTPAQ